MPSRFSRFLAELKRRKVYHVAVAYVAVGFALVEFRRQYEKDSENPNWVAWYALALAYDHEAETAAELIEPIATAHPDKPHAILAAMQIRALRGDREGFLRKLDGPLHDWFRERVWATRVAAAFALLDEREEALNWLEHAVNCGFIHYPLFSEKDPWLESIRGEERFQDLMARVRHEWESFEV